MYVDRRVAITLHEMKKYCQFGVLNNKSEFIGFDNIEYRNNRLYYFKNRIRRSVVLLIKHVKEISLVNWIDHLYYKDGYNRIRLFKDLLRDRFLGINL